MHAESIRLDRVGFAHSDAMILFENVSLVLLPGWTGLVGANGAGKSTLLRLLAGQLPPTTGTVHLQPAGARVVLCAQEAGRADASIATLATSPGHTAGRLRSHLELDPGRLEQWCRLSPGERKRWQIGAALLQEPDVLLLDEPTNHLDARGRGWLAGVLRRFRGIGVVVAHDRDLLEALTTATLRVDRQAVRLWRGAYGAARLHWEAERQTLLEAHTLAAQRRQELERRLDRTRRQHQAAVAQRSARRRMRDRHDADARSIGARTRAEWAEARRGRQVAAARRSSERATAALDQIAVDRELGRSVFARYEPSPARYLAVREQAPLCVQQRLLLRPPALVLGRADRIWVTGPNGAGKSSLIAAMLDSLRVPPRQVFHLPQELGEEQAGAALARLRRLADAERSELLAIVAALGVAPERLLSTPRPSPGQARKLLIAEALARRVWGLVLDEPTNHLDLPSIERLERALAEYPGALLLVTHDQALARRCTSACWLVEDGGVTVSAPS